MDAVFDCSGLKNLSAEGFLQYAQQTRLCKGGLFLQSCVNLRPPAAHLWCIVQALHMNAILRP